MVRNLLVEERVLGALAKVAKTAHGVDKASLVVLLHFFLVFFKQQVK